MAVGTVDMSMSIWLPVRHLSQYPVRHLSQYLARHLSQYPARHLSQCPRAYVCTHVCLCMIACAAYVMQILGGRRRTLTESMRASVRHEHARTHACLPACTGRDGTGWDGTGRDGG